MPGGPRGALVDEVNGDSICDQIPLPHGHGSVNFRFSMIPSWLKFQVSPASGCAGPIRKGNFSRGTCTIAGRIPYPILNQRVTSFSHLNLELKFQVRPTTGCPGAGGNWLVILGAHPFMVLLAAAAFGTAHWLTFKFHPSCAPSGAGPIQSPLLQALAGKSSVILFYLIPKRRRHLVLVEARPQPSRFILQSAIDFQL